MSFSFGKNVNDGIAWQEVGVVPLRHEHAGFFSEKSEAGIGEWRGYSARGGDGDKALWTL